MPDPGQQLVLRHGFDQKGQYVAFPDAVRLGKMGIGCRKNDGRLIGLSAQRLDELQAARPRHFHIDDQAPASAERWRLHRRFGGTKHQHIQVVQFQKDANGMKHGLVIVDHADAGFRRRIVVCGHVIF